MESERLERVIMYADKAHGDQKRKYTGERYINHPVRVMRLCSDYLNHEAVLAAAILHDVLEDTPVTVDELRGYLLTEFSEQEARITLSIVVELTDVFTKSSYPRLKRRTRKEREVSRLSTTSFEAQTVKYCDVIDNAIDIAKHDSDFGKVFLSECQRLLEVMDKGDSMLYQRACITVRKCIDSLKTPTHQG
jgi:guanosine-3',5'-bis(diphosphate) 3'-pyrophosphohydrolase